MEISTFGWDLIYAMRFPQVNKELGTAYDQEVERKTNYRQDLSNKLGGGHSQKVKGQLIEKGTDYSLAPIVNIAGYGFDERISTIKPVLSLKNIVLTNGGANFTSAPTIIISTTDPTDIPASISTKILIKEIGVGSIGSGYLDGSAIPCIFSGNIGDGTLAAILVI